MTLYGVSGRLGNDASIATKTFISRSSVKNTTREAAAKTAILKPGGIRSLLTIIKQLSRFQGRMQQKPAAIVISKKETTALPSRNSTDFRANVLAAITTSTQGSSKTTDQPIATGVMSRGHSNLLRNLTTLKRCFPLTGNTGMCLAANATRPYRIRELLLFFTK